MAFSPDGLRLVAGSDDKTLRLWDAASGKELCSHWASAMPEAEGSAAWEPARLLHARGKAWRWLAWQVWSPTIALAANPSAPGQW